MIKVSRFWRMGAMILLGMVLGIFVSIKWIAPPPSDQDIRVGRIIIRGRNNTVEDTLDISKADSADQSKNKKRIRQKNRSE